jgi:O-antigen/teichoic acid export membrane protein
VTRGRIEQRAAKISVVTGLSTVISIAGQLLSVPVCLHYWGSDNYGRWLALYAAFMLVRSLDSGLVAYVGNKLNYLYHRDDGATREHLASGLVGITVVGLAQLALIGAAMASPYVGRLLGLTEAGAASREPAVALFVMLFTWVMCGSYLGIVHRLLIPTGMMFEAAWWFIIFQIGQFGGLMLAAYLRFDILGASILFSAIQLVLYLASAVWIRQRLPHYFPWWRGGRMRTGLRDLRSSLVLTASGLVQQGSTNGSVILLSYLAGPAIVPIYTTTRTLANLWTNVSNVLAAPLLPEVVRYHASGEAGKIVTVTEAYWLIAGATVNLGILLVHPFLEPLYFAWTGEALAFDRALAAFLLASIVLVNLGGLISVLMSGINSLGAILSVSVVRAVVMLGGGGALYGTMGVAAFGIGALAAEALVLFILVRLFLSRELRAHETALRLSFLASTALGAGSLLAYLAAAAFDREVARYLYVPAAVLIIVATVRSWKLLAPEFRERLTASLITAVRGTRSL